MKVTLTKEVRLNEEEIHALIRAYIANKTNIEVGTITIGFYSNSKAYAYASIQETILQ